VIYLALTVLAGAAVFTQNIPAAIIFAAFWLGSELKVQP